jgi:hypothetical protein
MKPVPIDDMKKVWLGEKSYTDVLKEVAERSYPDEFPEENGYYENTCVVCKNDFYGHKYRRVCKKCNDKKGE